MRLRSSSAFCSSDQTRSWLRRREGCHDLVLLVSSMDFFLGGGVIVRLTSSSLDRHPFWIRCCCVAMR